MTTHEAEILKEGARELGLVLAEADIAGFSLFTDEILRWNNKINLTALKTVLEIITKHYLDSLSIVSLLPEGASLLDIGSGGGFPSIPLKIVRPDLTVVSVDAVLKKINFQRHIARQLGLIRFTPLHARAEQLASAPENRFDFVIARAVADLPALVRLGMPLLADKGRLIAMKGSQGRVELDRARAVLEATGISVTDILEFRLPVSSDERTVIVLTRSNPEKHLKH